MTLPSVPDAFEWSREAWGPALRCRPLGAIAPHLFTTRQLELSACDGVQQLSDALRVRDLAMLTQVHGNTVSIVRRDHPVPSGRPEADVLVSDRQDVAIAVRAADCVPLLLADRATGAVAAVHAGWRGTAKRAAVAAVDALGREFGTRPADLVAAIGPCIRGCCYDVGSEVVDAFAGAGHGRHLIDRWFLASPPPLGSRERPRLRLDLEAANRDQLMLAGLRERNIHLSGLCTAMHLDVLTSYRVEKQNAGRIVAAVRGRGRPRPSLRSPDDRLPR